MGKAVPAAPSKDALRYDQQVLQALRRIMRAADMHSRQLSTQYSITAPQLVALSYIGEFAPLTLRSLAEGIHLSSSTLVGILDRLEAKGFVTRKRDTQDRRKVIIELTSAGRDFLKRAPSPLQDKLGAAMARLPEAEQAGLAAALDRVVELMEAGDIEAAPVLHGGLIHPPE